MDWEPIAGPSGAQPVAGPRDAQSSAPIDLTMSSSPDDAQPAWPTHYPATQQSRQPLEQSSSEDDLPILKLLPPLSRFLLNTTITICNQSLGNLDDWSLVGAIANPNIANAKRNLLVQELHARTRHGVLRLSPGEINVTSLPSSSAPSTIGAEDNLIDFSPVPSPQPQLVSKRNDETLLKVSESTYVAVTDAKGQSKDIKGKGKATREEPTTTSIKITRTTLDPTGARQSLTAKHLLLPAPRKEVTSKRGAAVAKLIAQDQLRSAFPIPSAIEARELKDAIVVLYNVYVRMRGKMKKSRINAADEDVIAALAMFDGKASESAKRRFRRIDHAALSAAALVAHFFSVARGTGAGQGMQSQTAKQVGAFTAWNALATSFEGDPQYGVIKKMIDQKFSAEALTLSLRDAPKMLSVDHPHLATQPTNAVVNASTYDNVILHPSFQPAFTILCSSATGIAARMHALGRDLSKISHLRILYNLTPQLDQEVRSGLTASRQAVAGRPPVTAGLRPIPDNVAIGGNHNAVGTLWTTILHQFIKQTIKDEIAKLRTSGATVVHKLVHFNKDRSGLAFFARCIYRTRRSSNEALQDVHHLCTPTIVIGQAANAQNPPFLPPVRDNPLFGDILFEAQKMDDPTVELALCILDKQIRLVSIVESLASSVSLLSLSSYHLADFKQPLTRMKSSDWSASSVTISERLAGSKTTIQAGAVSAYFTGLEDDEGEDKLLGKAAPDSSIGHLFALAIYSKKEDEPVLGCSQRVRNKAEQFFQAKGWQPGQILVGFEKHLQELVGTVTSTYSAEYTKLDALGVAAAGWHRLPRHLQRSGQAQYASPLRTSPCQT